MELEPGAVPPVEAPTCETRDGSGAGDHDAPYVFNRKFNSQHHPSVSEPQYLRLLILRSRYQAGLIQGDDPGLTAEIGEQTA